MPALPVCPPYIQTVQRTTRLAYNPMSPYPIWELRNPWIDEFYVVQERRATEFKAPKLGKGSSGSIQKKTERSFSPSWI